MPIHTALIAELTYEAANTRKMIERVPADQLSWCPHEKSMTIGRLATHIAEIPVWIGKAVNAAEFDFSTANLSMESKENTEAILKTFDKELADAIMVLESASDENLNAQWTLRRGEHIYFQMPRKLVIRNFSFNHLYHHRGQLSVYLRLLNIPVPGMYGPTADEQM